MRKRIQSAKLDSSKIRSELKKRVKEQQSLEDSQNINSFDSNYNFVIGKQLTFELINTIDGERVQILSDFGYPREYVFSSLQENEANYCTTGYYLLGLDQNY